MPIALEQIRQMPVGQRIQLAGDIWDTFVGEDADFPLRSDQLTELETRRAAMLVDPSIGIPWTEAKALLQTGSRQTRFSPVAQKDDRILNVSFFA